MLSLNRVELIGHLGRDPEIRFTQDNKKVATLSLATKESWKDRDGRKNEETEWHKLVAWGRLADLAEKHITKGDYIRVVGALKTRKWTDQQGQDRYSTEIILREIGFLEPKADQAPADISEDEIPY